mmetsp:Transcript_25899/g.56208  ORF Transcript_25899/g.56208 Transcript_25899/m.56208 type:complete len:335 (-) Transcript_25899:223-1227(-)|eukprot:CAMPEP_0118924566 /NCGR_PEP_ID=MMETSP1169-20130426/2646_1 /TAXON_ID=36882 /ORGANISM="Pyramimonas obovata, Strain CCMP722" /LENGTH=334 /DNA_ID=CAMNT_0006865693 /DNA_START=268 /DNA_END=1272 /DNA_ORIENTATION=-
MSASSPTKKSVNFSTGRPQADNKFSALKKPGNKIVTSLTDSGKFKQLFTEYDPLKRADILQIVLVRHGQTDANAAHINQGQSDSELNGNGHQMALLLGKALARESYAAVYQSDLVRVRQTTEIIKKCQPANHTFEVEDHELLRERNAGEFEGEPVGSVDAAARACGQIPREYVPKFGESWGDVNRRADEFIQQLLENHLPPPSAGEVAENKLRNKGMPKKDPNTKTILVVTHGGFIKEFINVVSHYGGGQLVTSPAIASTTARPYGQPRWPANGQLTGNGGSPNLYPNKARNASIYRFNMMWRNGRLVAAMTCENDISHLRGLATTGPLAEVIS